MSPRAPVLRLRFAITLLLLCAAPLAALAQEAYEPRELSEQVHPMVEFQFRPQVGEGWVEHTTAVVVLTWESAGAESTVLDSVYREMTWEVMAETDSGYLVRWSYGPQRHFLNGEELEGMVAERLKDRSFGLIVDPSGEALSAMSAEELSLALAGSETHADAIISTAGMEDPPEAIEIEQPDPSDPENTPGRMAVRGPDGVIGWVERDSLAGSEPEQQVAPPPYDPLVGFALRDWNNRLDVFYGQIWDEGVSVFELEEISVPGMSTQRLFSELWLERVLSPEERPVAHVEVRYFTVPTDTLPLDDEGFLEFLTTQGISGLSSPALTDLVAGGRGKWYIDAGRLLLYQGTSLIEGMVQQWPVEGAGSSITAHFTIRRQRHAGPLMR
jgi:hypothetical protein